MSKVAKVSLNKNEKVGCKKSLTLRRHIPLKVAGIYLMTRRRQKLQKTVLNIAKVARENSWYEFHFDQFYQSRMGLKSTF